jgi:hypothetical protein
MLNLEIVLEIQINRRYSLKKKKNSNSNKKINKFTCKNFVHSICKSSSILRQLYKTFKLIGLLDAKHISRIARQMSICS